MMKISLWTTIMVAFLFLNCINAQDLIGNKIMEKKKNYSVEIIRYNISQDKASDFENAYKEAGRFLQDSPYCLGYNVLHGEEEPNHYLVTIYWTSKEDHLNGFRKSNQFSSFFNLVKLYFNAIEEMKHYNETSISWSKDPLNNGDKR